jgi:hypothetical protein
MFYRTPRLLVLSVVLALLGCSGGGQAADASHAAARDQSDGMSSSCPIGWDFKVPSDDTATATSCPPAWPHIPNGETPPPSVVSIVTITTAGDPVADELASFGADLVASTWWSVLAQMYALDPAPTAIHWSGPAIPPSDAGASLSQQDLETYIRSVINDPSVATPSPPASAQPIYMLYVPQGVILGTDMGANTACRFLRGYHFSGASGSGAFSYGVAQRCEGGITLGPGPSPTEMLTIAGSHEIAEIATDPFLTGYRIAADSVGPWLSSGGEVGDLCVSAWHLEGRWNYQRFWSNAAAASGGDPCVPGPATPPPVFVGPAWTALPSNHMIRIPLTGCNLPAQSIWRLNVSIKPSDPSLCSFVSIEQGTQTSFPATLVTTARQPALLIALDASAPSGTSAVVTIAAHPSDMHAANLPEPDGADLYSVGVFVP